MSKPQITTHYANGTVSETRDMTDEEIAIMEANAMLPLFPNFANEEPTEP